MRVTCRPLSNFPATETRNRRRAPFFRKNVMSRMNERVLLSDSLHLVTKEARALGCSELVLEADYRETDFRLDGGLRANANPRSPRIVVSLVNSKHGPLRYPCDTFDRFEDNVRAVGLALEALRMVDRYGVTRRGEQYAGWKALPSSTEPTVDVESAARILAAEGGPAWEGRAASIKGEAVHAKAAALDSLRRTHPDVGGSADAFHRVQVARKVLSAHHKTTI